MAQDTVPDPLDIRILDALQQEIPLVPRPWEEISARLGIPEMVLLERLQRLCDAGIIRGISPIVESRPMGLAGATLVAIPVPQDRITQVAALISRYPEVSHNFRRDHHYSLWFTLAAKDNAGIRQALKKILSETGIPENTILNLPTVRKIKINVQFSFIRKQKEHSRGSA